MVITIANSDVLLTRREVDEATFTRAGEIIINDWESVTANRQIELLEPIEKGLVRRENVHTLGDIVDGRGEIAFGALQAGLDMEYSRSSVGFTWEGFDEMDEVSGDGSAELLDDGAIEIEFGYHNGDEARPQSQTRYFFNSLPEPDAPLTRWRVVWEQKAPGIHLELIVMKLMTETDQWVQFSRCLMPMRAPLRGRRLCKAALIAA